MKNFKLVSIAYIIAIFSSFLFLYSCSKSSSVAPPAAAPGTNEVWMQNTAFVPSVKTITVGTTITWTNKDNADHDVTSNNGSFFSPTMGKNATYSHKFDAVGTYDYNCTFHSGMTGKIIVQ
jgi:plastocyanin